MSKRSVEEEYIYQLIGSKLWHCIYMRNGQVVGEGWGITQRAARQAAEQDAGE